MADTFQSLWQEERTTAARPMSNAAPRRLPAASPAGAGARRRFVTDRLNSRLAVPLPSGGWSGAWDAELGDEFSATAVLPVSERIVVQGEGRWALLDAAGRPLGHGMMLPCDIAVDEERGSFYVANRSGGLTVLRLDDGVQDGLLALNFGHVYRRNYVARRGDDLLVASTEREVDMHAAEPPQWSTIEVQRLAGQPSGDDELARLLSPSTCTADLMRRTLRLPVALHGDTVVGATENLLITWDWSLNAASAWKGEFTPLWLSLDETGRMYLIVQVGRDARFWLVAPDGKREMDVPLPLPASEWRMPPVVGYGHSICLAARDCVYALDGDHEHCWCCRFGGAIGGAAVTADDQLLVACGDAVLAFDRMGARRELCHVTGEAFRTAPVLTQDGMLLVASARRLYAFSCHS
ncbi:MAG: hypothetical protein C4547_13975 [Phycisphaerales bacterium]|nr:MAG: hypothetical protein C4547_13975 [Phycisphaerales bacterium]